MISEISEDELREMDERASRAAAGPWTAWVEGRDFLGGSSIVQKGETDESETDFEMSGATAADYDFIAAARQDVPRLIREVRRLRALLKEHTEGPK